MEGLSSTTNRTTELSDSNSSSSSRRHEPAAQPTPTLKFKGVVSQQNGHWGAQIYYNHQRIWLGTFKSENDAAMAYDSAAIRLRNGQTHRNFTWTNHTVLEPAFQSQFSTETVLAMIKDGSYFAKFSEYVRAQDHHHHHHQLAAAHPAPPGVKVTRLFEKELTPSDVSKLNRLVIPKKYAVKYFPQIQSEEEARGNRVDDVELVFFDQLMRSWKFRYCYWKSSQSYVFTRGWNRFAKEKRLKHRDRVVFSSCECNDGVRGVVQKILMIDVSYHDGGFNLMMQPHEEVKQEEEEDGAGDNTVSPPPSVNNKRFKLFGVYIDL